MTRKILITENDTDVKFLLSSILKNRYSLSFISSGKQVLHGLYEIPDLFILNSKLPDVNILEVYNELKSNERTKDIPILIISASADIEELMEECPGNDFLIKPFNGADLQKKIDENLAEKK
ncbi:Response regulator receiver domain-containing protein [Chitinophaga sp. CF118]|uniref:response regulator n=1 Tax=Chitinophaga sp. CF118 TaxID=1884367 RepID=UPI0008F390A2|nr:response regulator [Chitinophaga sp. CF118]SFD58276.1 Response regulator receiver domain-containing protein [Chitinophaga sp. CF118]